MEEKLKPQEAYYLNRPVRSDPTEMLKYALMGLDMNGDIDIFFKNIYINRNAKYKRPRMFIRLGANYNATNAYTYTEAFLLSKIGNEDMRLFEFRNLIANGLNKKIKLFKSDYVRRDLSKKGFLLTTWFLSSLGRQKIRKCRAAIDEIDKNIDSLLLNKKRLDTILSELGSNTIFLEDNTLKKLKKKILDLDELDRYFDPQISYISYGGGYGGYVGGGGYGGGGWGGYGGGSFGGGGSGGSW